MTDISQELLDCMGIVESSDLPSDLCKTTVETIYQGSLAIERLTAGLITANKNHEHFERKWYLRGDEVERLSAEVSDLSDRLCAAVMQNTWCVCADGTCEGGDILGCKRNSPLADAVSTRQETDDG